MFANIVWTPKLANIPPCCICLIPIINGNCIFSHSLAELVNMVQGRTGWQAYPLKSGGLRTFLPKRLQQHEGPNSKFTLIDLQIMI